MYLWGIPETPAIKGFTSLEPFTDFGSKHWALNVDTILEARDHCSGRPLADEGKRSGPSTKGVPEEQLKEHMEMKTSHTPWWGIENRKSAMDWQNIVTTTLEKAPPPSVAGALETINSREDGSGGSAAVTDHDDDVVDVDLDSGYVFDRSSVETGQHQQLQPTGPSFQGDTKSPKYIEMKNFTEEMSTWIAESMARLQNRSDRAYLLAMTQDYIRLNLIPVTKPAKSPQKALKKPVNNSPCTISP